VSEKVHVQSFLTSASDGGEWSNSGPGSFTVGKKPNLLIEEEGLAGPEVALNAENNFFSLPEIKRFLFYRPYLKHYTR
jgi:hypothetical protein